MFKNEKKLTLWTIQSSKFYDQMQKTGVIHTDIELSNLYDDFSYEYNWMADQMKQRIGKPNNEDTILPIWAWYQWDGKRKRRDIRTSGLGKKGTKMVQIEFEISPNQVLLSDFDAWNVVLNNGYLGDTDEDDTNFYNKYQGINIWNGSLFTDARANEMLMKMKKSWEKIFDLDKCIEMGFATNNSQSIQATVWEVKSEWIHKVDFFTAR